LSGRDRCAFGFEDHEEELEVFLFFHRPVTPSVSIRIG
jgi:hypothetical protein